MRRLGGGAGFDAKVGGTTLGVDVGRAMSNESQSENPTVCGPRGACGAG